MGLSKRNLLCVLCCLCLNLGVAIDTITSSQSIKDPEYIISNGSVFKLGFFSPVNSTNRYLGIWFNNISVFTVIWIANREKPLKNSSGVLTISEDGNLVVLDGQKEILWSSNVTNSVVNSSAQLSDSGNLVLQENNRLLWESFQHPSDKFLPKMKISTDVRTGKKVQLTSWKNPSDPSIGNFSAGLQPLSLPQELIWKDGSPCWRSGPWNSRIFIGIADMTSEFLDGFSLVDDKEGTFSYSFSVVNLSLSHFVLNTEGNIVLRYWDDEKEDWAVRWSALQTECDAYGKCGTFGSCNSQSSPICSCLRGFEPRNTEEWNKGNWTKGCVRRTPLQCERVNTGGEQGKNDGFLKLNMMKVPDFADWSSAHEDECRHQCLEKCSCIAYAYETGIGCMSWNRSLIDTQKFSSSGVDLYIRAAYSELGKLFCHLSKFIIYFKSCAAGPVDRFHCLPTSTEPANSPN
jgi:hypothetical protein